ncbi:MAG: Zn-ribbon domain-containing OB-fold protein [Deltaproteobacteria bacterium]|nr:Zn-ribbon domain-containing OB-fold protein [Deltaproteobacteria bacterium]
MSNWIERVEPLTLKGQIKVPYTWSVGEVGSRFLVSLRDDQKIIGNRCSECKTVFVPPRMNCGKCFKRITDWVDLSPEGKVEAFTIVRFAYPLQPTEPPYAYALIKLDGADVGFLHIIKGDLDRLKKEVRVKAKFAGKRTGHIRDIEGFSIV